MLSSPLRQEASLAVTGLAGKTALPAAGVGPPSACGRQPS
jgi:hypothetical protein